VFTDHLDIVAIFSLQNQRGSPKCFRKSTESRPLKKASGSAKGLYNLPQIHKLLRTIKISSKRPMRIRAGGESILWATPKALILNRNMVFFRHWSTW
jgi:hypothetical protein